MNQKPRGEHYSDASGNGTGHGALAMSCTPSTPIGPSDGDWNVEQRLADSQVAGEEHGRIVKVPGEAVRLARLPRGIDRVGAGQPVHEVAPDLKT